MCELVGRNDALSWNCIPQSKKEKAFLNHNPSRSLLKSHLYRSSKYDPRGLREG